MLKDEEIADLKQRLARDDFPQLCESYRRQPNPSTLPCARCKTLHTKESFFESQLTMDHEHRQYKLNAVLQICPCQYITWEDLGNFSLNGRFMPFGTPLAVCNECESLLKLQSVSLQGQPTQPSIPMGAGRIATPHTRFHLGSGCRLKSPEVGQGTMLDYPGTIQRLLALSSFPICPHLTTASPEMKKALGTAKYYAGNRPPRGVIHFPQSCHYTETEPQKCSYNGCGTEVWVFSPRTHGITPFDRHMEISVRIVKSLGALNFDKGPLMNNSWLAQLTMPEPGARRLQYMQRSTSPWEEDFWAKDKEDKEVRAAEQKQRIAWLWR